jgi:hypothetical protein
MIDQLYVEKRAERECARTKSLLLQIEAEIVIARERLAELHTLLRRVTSKLEEASILSARS